nr:hypothetical protein [Tanacetum cinerariifolium]
MRSLGYLLHEPLTDDNPISRRSSSRHSTLEVDRINRQFLEGVNGSSSLAYLILDEFEAPQSPPSPDYVPGLKYPEYVALSDDEIPDPKKDLADYPTDEGDADEEEDSFEDDEEEEAFEDDGDEEEEHLASVDSTVLPAIDSVPSAEDTKPFETEESAATPPPP